MHIRIILPIHNPAFFKDAELSLPANLAREGVKIDVVQLDSGPEFIMSRYEEAISVPGILQRIIEAEKEGADAVIVNCMGDPGVAAARELVRIPVIGPAQTAMHVASTLGFKFAILSVDKALGSLFEELAKVYSLEHRLKSIVSVELPVGELVCNLDMAADEIYEHALQIVQNHQVDTIIMGCTGMFGCREKVRQKLLKAGYDVQVIDPLPLAVDYACMLLKADLTHSSLAYHLYKIK
ncbi:MAG: hydrogenase expression protein HupH [Gammaproteobacteria bacterium]|jgi:allantoin racemase|nr:hydrogenase expression protein HupH [Gammaproteobacteria bacterium]